MSVSLYDYTPFHRNIHGRILYAQTAEHYTTEEIQHLYSLCRSVYERDYLVDRLYLASQHNRRGKKKTSITTTARGRCPAILTTSITYQPRILDPFDLKQRTPVIRRTLLFLCFILSVTIKLFTSRRFLNYGFNF